MSTSFTNINTVLKQVLEDNNFTQSPVYFDLEKNPSSIKDMYFSIRGDGFKSVNENPDEDVIDCAIKISLSFLNAKKPDIYLAIMDKVFALRKALNSSTLTNNEIYLLHDFTYTDSFSKGEDYLIAEINFNLQFNLSIEV
jgi:hypothetical protein